MRVYLVTDGDFEELRQSLDFKRMRDNNIGSSKETHERNDMHRAFNYVVVNWYQAIQKRERMKR